MSETVSSAPSEKPGFFESIKNFATTAYEGAKDVGKQATTAVTELGKTVTGQPAATGQQPANGGRKKVMKSKKVRGKKRGSRRR
jgi:hypothetical protein